MTNPNGDGQKGENNEQIPVLAQTGTALSFQEKKKLFLKSSQTTSQNIKVGSLRTKDRSILKWNTGETYKPTVFQIKNIIITFKKGKKELLNAVL